MADPAAERVRLGRDAAAFGERRVESLALRDREHRAAADERARQRVGLPWPVADRNVDRDALHVGERGEVRFHALEQSRLAKAAVDQDDCDPAALGAVDAGYELCHAASLPTNGRGGGRHRSAVIDQPCSDGTRARPRTARRPPRPALPRRVGALRFAGGRRGPRPGDVRARALAAATPSQRGRPRLPPARAAQHVPQRAQNEEPQAPPRAAPRPDGRRRRSQGRAAARPRSRPGSSMPPSPLSRKTSGTSSSPSTSRGSRTRRQRALCGFAREP